MDHLGKLDEAELKKVSDWIRDKCPDYRCTACGSAKWFVTDHLVSPPIFTIWTAGDSVAAGPAYPMALVCCSNCFRMESFSAVAIGVVRPGPRLPTKLEAGNGN